MTEETDGKSAGAPYLTVSMRQRALATRLTECVEELDAFGLYCEANHVALGRDLLLERVTPPSKLLGEEAGQPIPLRSRKRD